MATGPASPTDIEAGAAALQRALDAALAFRRDVAEHSGRPALDYSQMRERLAAPTPETAMPAAALVDELVDLVTPGLMPIPGPRFFGWVMGASDLAGVAADWLVTAWGQNTAFHTPTPGAAAIEEIAEGWLLDLLDLPRESRIGFATGATTANMTALAAARDAVLREAGWNADVDGLFGAPPITVMVGADAHSSIYSALQFIGLGSRRIVTIATDAQGGMQAEALGAALAAASGPKIVILQAGQINTGAFDPFADLVGQAKAAGAWVHVDGAFGLWARAAPKLRHLTDGLEAADSWVTDGHKWLQVPYDCGFAIVRDRQALARAMTQWSSYLPDMVETDRVPSQYVPELSRRARGVAVWALIKAFGREGIAALVERHCALARRFAERLGNEPGIHVVNEVVLNQVVVTFGDGDAALRRETTQQAIAAIQQDGTCFAAGAEWHGQWVMRLSVTSGATTEADIDRSAEAIIAAWRAMRPA